MKKHFRKIAGLLVSIMVIAAMLSGCGKSDPTEEDAKKYVKATIDFLCTGEYDKSVKFADVEEGKEQESRDAIIEGLLGDVASEYSLDDATMEQFRTFIDSALSKCRYTVTDAVRTDDNGKTGYDVTVSIEPVKIFDGAEAAMQDVMANMLSDASVMNMSQEEITGMVFTSLFEVLNGNLENPQYAAAEEVVVHYGLIDEKENTYGVSEEDGEKVGEKLFSLEGLE